MTTAVLAQLALTVIVALVGALFAAFMWGLKGKIEDLKDNVLDLKDELEKRRKDIREIYKTKVDEKTCVERRQHCDKERAVA